MPYNDHRVIDIFGSCVSRDIIENCASSIIQCGHYIARSSFSSAVASPPSSEIDEQQITLDSAFQRRSVLQDINKTGLKMLAESPGDYLLIDFFEERFPVATRKGSIVTLSSEFQNSGIPFSDKTIWRNLDETIGGTTFSALFSLFVEKVRSIYPESKIILHKAYLCNEYISKNGSVLSFPKDIVNWNNSINQKLYALYRAFEEAMPGCQIIDLCAHYIGSEENKWGLASTHYQDEYYKCAAKELEKTVHSKRTSPLAAALERFRHFGSSRKH